MPNLYALNDDDLALLRELTNWWRSQRGNSSGKYMVPEDNAQTPEVYLVRTPAGGIPALADQGTTGTGTAGMDDTPGSAECDVYRVYDGQFVKLGFTRRVYNVTGIAIAQGMWVLAVRDKFGIWYAPTMGLQFTECP